MNIDGMLEKWCEKKGIDVMKIPEEIWNTTINRIEDDIDEFIDEKSDQFVDEWAFLNIEQELPEHPEWKLK